MNQVCQNGGVRNGLGQAPPAPDTETCASKPRRGATRTVGRPIRAPVNVLRLRKALRLRKPGLGFLLALGVTFDIRVDAVIQGDDISTRGILHRCRADLGGPGPADALPHHRLRQTRFVFDRYTPRSRPSRGRRNNWPGSDTLDLGRAIQVVLDSPTRGPQENQRSAGGQRRAEPYADRQQDVHGSTLGLASTHSVCKMGTHHLSRAKIGRIAPVRPR